MSQKWLVFIVIYIGSVAASINQFKVPPVMDLVVKDLGFSMGNSGWLMSCFALAGFLLAIPAGLLIKTRHLRGLSIIGLTALTLGGIFGALTTGPISMLVGRVLEGIGVLSMGMAGPTLICLWFPQGERGLPLGIWSSWMPAGSILMFNLAQPLVTLGGWRAIWWFVSALSFIALLLFIRFIQVPEVTVLEEQLVHQAWRDIFLKVFYKKDLWLLTLMFISYNFVLSSYYSWVPVYLKQTLALEPRKAALTVSLIHLGIIPTTLVVGLILGRLQNYRQVYRAGFIAFSIILLKSFMLNTTITTLYMLTLGVLSGLIPAAIFAAIPVVIGNKQYMPFASGAILWGQNIGVLLGPSSVGILLSTGVSWDKVTYLLVTVAMVGLIAALLSRTNIESQGIDNRDIKAKPSQ